MGFELESGRMKAGGPIGVTPSPEVDSSIVYKAVNEVTDWFGNELKK